MIKNKLAKNLFYFFFLILNLSVLSHAISTSAITGEQSFSPSTIGPGSQSTLTYTLTNASSAEDRGIEFTSNLPMGLTIIAPENVQTTCRGDVVAQPWELAFSNGILAANSSCTISVSTTATETATVPAQTQAQGRTSEIGITLTSDSGSSLIPATTLIVDHYLLGFSSSFDSPSIAWKSVSKLHLVINDFSGYEGSDKLSFNNQLPDGIIVATPANVVNTCNGIVTAVDGSNQISLVLGDLPSTSCDIIVNVLGTTIGKHQNTISLYRGSTVSEIARTSALLTVTGNNLLITKNFVNDPAPPGGTVDVEYVIINNDRLNSVSGIAFTDDFDFGSTALSVASLPENSCGSGSQLTGVGTSSLSLSSGFLAAGASCTFTITLQIPSDASGTFESTLLSVTASAKLNGSSSNDSIIGNTATDFLTVYSAPILSKNFTPDVLAPGGSGVINFVITNNDATEDFSAVAFSDELSGLSGIVLDLPPKTNTCGGAVNGFPEIISFTGGAVPKNTSCTISIEYTLSDSISSGTYSNTSSAIVATLNSNPVVGKAATDTLTITDSAPSLSYSFNGNPIPAGSSVSMDFQLNHSLNATAAASNISFTIDLDTILPGVVTSSAQTGICGGSSSISGTGILTFSGGSLDIGTNCNFSVQLQIPSAIPRGDYTITSSAVSAVVSSTVSSPVVSNDLVIADLIVTTSFTNPVLPGETTNIHFKIENVNPTFQATSIAFQKDRLSNTLSGIVINSLPSNPCGIGSSISGTDNLSFNGGIIDAGSLCEFDVPITVPVSAAIGTYSYVNSGFLFYTANSVTFIQGYAINNPLIVDNGLVVTQNFLKDAVAPGATVELEFTITNGNSLPATGIEFEDNLDAALLGLVAVGLPDDDICGTGSSINGSKLINLTGGSLAANSSCTFTVTIKVPDNTIVGSTINNTATKVKAIFNANILTSGDALASVKVNTPPLFSQSLSSTTIAAGSTSVLTYTINNTAGLGNADTIDFTHSFPANVALASPPTPSSTCGAATSFDAIAGSQSFSVSGASVLVAKSCTIQVSITTLTKGAFNTNDVTFTSSTGSATATGKSLTATLVALSFSKSFSPSSIVVGDVSTLTYSINNSNNIDVATINMSDTLPSNLLIATPANVVKSCTGGTVFASAGGSTISYSNGSASANQACTISVDVTSNSVGTYTSTSDPLASDAGTSTAAVSTLFVRAQPVASTPTVSIYTTLLKQLNDTFYIASGFSIHFSQTNASLRIINLVVDAFKGTFYIKSYDSVSLLEFPSGLYISKDGDIQLVTKNGTRITLGIEPNSSSLTALTAVLKSLGYTIERDKDRNILFVPAGTLRVQTVLSWFSTRAGIVSEPLEETPENLGFVAYNLAYLKNTLGVRYVYEDAGKYYQQDYYAFPTQWSALKTYLQQILSTEQVTIDHQGIISIIIGDITYRAVMGFEVKSIDSGTGEFVLVTLDDLNNDGSPEFEINYPNGEQQVVYLLEQQN